MLEHETAACTIQYGVVSEGGPRQFLGLTCYWWFKEVYPNYLCNVGFFFVGTPSQHAPHSGHPKTQARERPGYPEVIYRDSIPFVPAQSMTSYSQTSKIAALRRLSHLFRPLLFSCPILPGKAHGWHAIGLGAVLPAEANLGRQ